MSEPRIDRVVVPIDGSSVSASALAPARALVAAAGARLRLLTAAPAAGAETVRAELQELADLEPEPVESVVVSDVGPVDAILREVHTPGTVVCMASHGRSGVGQALLGSVTEAVLRAAHDPLVLVGPRVETRLSALEPANLLVAVDGSPASETIVPVAARWARTLGLSVHVVEVVVPPVGILVHRNEDQARAYVGAVVERVRELGVDADGEVLTSGKPADEIVAGARRLPATMLAIATHGRTGLARIALGSVAMRVVHTSGCPVLVVRPADLVD